MRGARQHHLGRVRRVARQVALRDETAEALAEHGGLDDAQRIAKPHHIVGEDVQHPLLGRPRVAAAMATQVEIDDLTEIGEAAEEGPEGGVVKARAAVDEHQRGFLTQAGAVRDEAEALDVHEEPDTGLDFDAHPVSPPCADPA